MRIKLLLNLGAGWPRFLQDEIHEVDGDLGRRLLEQHLAVELPALEKQPDEIVSVPAEPPVDIPKPRRTRTRKPKTKPIQQELTNGADSSTEA